MHGFRFHALQNIRLALPIVFSQLSTVLIATADTVMVGNHSSIELAAAAFANNIFFLMVIPGFGLSGAIKPLVATAHAAEQLKDCRAYLRHGILVLLGYVLLVAFIWPVLEASLDKFGQPEPVVALARPFLQLVIFSLLPLMLFLGISQFMEALSETKIPMYLNFFGAFLNIGLNYLLIFGNFDFPELGLLGAGWATLLARMAMVIVAGFVLYFHPKFYAYRPESWRIWERIRISKLLKLGIPIGMQRMFEFTAFMFAALMAGWLGAVPLAAHQIALSLSMMTFMVAMGLAEGNTIHIANQVGRKAHQQVRGAGNSAFVLIFGFMATAAIIFLVFRTQIPLFYVSIDDPNFEAIQEVASVLLIWVALYQVADGVQVVAMGALRGIEDVQIPTLIALLAYWVIGIPVGYTLGFILEMGIDGIWLGLAAGLFTAAALLVWRFWRLSK